MVPPGIAQLACPTFRETKDETEETVADKYPFLSEEWVAEVRRLGDEARAEGGGAKIPHQVKMNQVITDVPFGDGTINAHMDTSTGEMQMEMGHMESPDLTVTLDYDTAKAIFVDGNPQAGMQAFMAGKVKVQGDMTKLMAMQAAPPDANAQAFAQKVKEMTAE
jgi:putative sterol carrier protein